MTMKLALNGVLALISTAAVAQTSQQVELPLNNSVISTLKGDLIPEHQEQAITGSALTPGSSLETVPESCRFSLSLAPGKKALEARSVSEFEVNRTAGTCEGQFEVGEPSPEELDALPPPSASETPTFNSGETVAADASPLASSAAAVTSAGYAKTWVTTVLGTVASGQAIVDWTWRGASACIKAVSNSGTAFAGGAGFRLHVFNVAKEISCGESRTVTDVTAVNSHAPLCRFTSVTLKFRTQAWGLQSGALKGTFNGLVTSRCNSRFKYHFLLKRTHN